MSRLPPRACVVAITLVLAVSSRPAAQVPAPRRLDAAAPLFDDSLLGDIRLLINSRDWETLKTTFQGNAYYPADFRWHDTTVRNVGIRSRGNGSRSGVKPGLRIDFDRYSTKQKFLGLKSVVLRNNTQDPSQLRERLSMAFFARMGFPAPREMHARLFINNAFAGLYTVVEALDRAFLERALGEDEGYLFAYDYPPDSAPYYFDYRGDDPSKYVPLPFRPETHETDSHPEVLERMIFTINSVDPAQFRTALDEFLDVRALVRFVAVEAFQAEQDGFLGEWGMNNYYLYRREDRHQFTHPAVGQEPGVLLQRGGLFHLAQHPRCARCDSQPADDASAQLPGSSRPVPGHAARGRASDLGHDAGRPTRMAGARARSAGAADQRRGICRHDKAVHERAIRSGSRILEDVRARTAGRGDRGSGAQPLAVPRRLQARLRAGDEICRAARVSMPAIRRQANSTKPCPAFALAGVPST